MEDLLAVALHSIICIEVFLLTWFLFYSQCAFQGTVVTIENFLLWKASFDQDMAELNSKKQKDEELSGKLKLTGESLSRDLKNCVENKMWRFFGCLSLSCHLITDTSKCIIVYTMYLYLLTTWSIYWGSILEVLYTFNAGWHTGTHVILCIFILPAL